MTKYNIGFYGSNGKMTAVYGESYDDYHAALNALHKYPPLDYYMFTSMELTLFGRLKRWVKNIVWRAR